MRPDEIARIRGLNERGYAPKKAEVRELCDALAAADAVGVSPPSASEEITISIALLEAITDADECSFDHHGGCQTHMFLDLEGEPCPIKLAQDALAAARARVSVPTKDPGTL